MQVGRICLQRSVTSSAVEVIDGNQLYEIMGSQEVLGVARQLRDCDEEAKDGVDVKDAISGLKRRLPAITPHACSFAGNRRKNENAVPSGLVMLDVDHVDNPREWWGTLGCFSWVSYNIYLIAITPSGHGLRIIGERERGESIAAGQARLARLFGFKEYDSSTRDLARLSFVMCADNVLYIDTGGFVWDTESEVYKYWTSQSSERSDLFGEKAEVETSAAPSQSCAAPKVLSASYPDNYEGIAYEDIVKQLEVLLGGEPVYGERNNMYFSMATNMRYICNFDANFLLNVLPGYGLSVGECEQTIKSALSRPRRSKNPQLLEQAIVLAKTGSEKEESAEVVDDVLSGELQMPRLPRVLQLICRRLPETYRPAMLIAALPVLGALATRVRFKYLDGQTHSFSFLSCVQAPSATGKSFIRKPIDLLLTPINEQDAIERENERVYKEKLRACRNKKEQPEDPHSCPRNNGINISIAALLKIMSYSDSKHLIAIGEEIDTLYKSEKAGVWSQKSDIYRLAFDNAMYGQQYVSDQSFSANVPVYYNLLITGTPGGVRRFFRNVEDGLVTRVAFASLPDMFATKIPRFEDYTDDEREYIIGVGRELDELSGMIECEKVSKALDDWQEKKRQYAEKTMSAAVDTFRRRAGVIGFRAGMLAYVLYGQKNGSSAAKFGEYIAEYVFREQIRLFGDAFEHESNEQEKLTEGNRGAVVALLDKLPQKFTTSELMSLRARNGASTRVNMIIHRWLKAGYIERVGEREYRKLKS